MSNSAHRSPKKCLIYYNSLMNKTERLLLGLRDWTKIESKSRQSHRGKEGKMDGFSSSPGDLPLGRRQQGREGEGGAGAENGWSRGGAQGSRARGGGTQGQRTGEKRLIYR
jgi:hypothetical protein